MSFYLGVTAGKTSLQVCIVDEDMVKVTDTQRKQSLDVERLNLRLIGELISTAVESSVDAAYLEPEAISAASIVVHSDIVDSRWLPDGIRGLLPHAVFVPSTYHEISLLGGRGEQFGVLLRAGVDSMAYGVNLSGETATVGNWGHLIGHEGGGYWVGLQALRAVVMAADRRGLSTTLTGLLLRTHGLKSISDVRPWLYNSSAPMQNLVTSVADLVLEAAENGDEVARKIIEQAASYLGLYYRTVQSQLNMQRAPLIFDGYLLEQPTPLQIAVMAQVGLQEPPKRQYSPVMGAALVAKLRSRKDISA